MNEFVKWLNRNCGWKEYKIINPDDNKNLNELKALENLNNHIKGFLITKERLINYISKQYPEFNSLFLNKDEIDSYLKIVNGDKDIQKLTKNNILRKGSKAKR